MALHIYTRKQRWKFFFLVIAILIGISSIWFTNNLVKKLSEEERKKMEIWAVTLRGITDDILINDSLGDKNRLAFKNINNAYADLYFQISKKLSEEDRKKMEKWALTLREITDDILVKNDSLDDQNRLVNEIIYNAYTNLVFQITSSNSTIPTIFVNENNDIIGTSNLRRFKVEEGKRFSFDALSEKDQSYLRKQLQIMEERNDPIEIQLSTGNNKLYYKNSFLITQLFWFPFFQLAVVFLFILVSYLAINSSNIAEQNQVWVGMSKETAHQLGTPISSLLAWVELLKGSKHNLVPEIAKDVQRLEKIAERFSKIGSAPILRSESIIEVLENSIEYLKSRSSDKINFVFDYPSDQELFVPVNVSLFEWVIENLCKNSIDAMDGKGEISIRLTDHNQVLFLDIEDSGKGIAKSQFKAIFQPGFTTKQRGWGLGLSLSNRIIENYHAGKIFVKRSELNMGTTFRIVLKK